MEFKDWMKKVDAITYRKFGVSIHDLPDMCFRDAYDGGETPEEFVSETVENVLEDEGYPSE